jgi:hypothetical protein
MNRRVTSRTTRHSIVDPLRSQASFRLPEAILNIASRLRSTSSSVVAQEETLIRIAVRPCQVVPPHQQVPSD